MHKMHTYKLLFAYFEVYSESYFLNIWTKVLLLLFIIIIMVIINIIRGDNLLGNKGAYVLADALKLNKSLNELRICKVLQLFTQIITIILSE